MKQTEIDINEYIIKTYVESKRPEDLEIRKQMDIGYSYDGKVAILYQIRSVWRNPDKIQRSPFAKIRFYKLKSEWKLYWMPASLKWQLYEPFPKSTHLENIIKTIDDDKNGCFYG